MTRCTFTPANLDPFGDHCPGCTDNHKAPVASNSIRETNSDTQWKDAEDRNLSQVDEYNTFIDLGKNGKAPVGYKSITVHLVYGVKHDGRSKARLVAGGYLTGTPIESVYFGVVSLLGSMLVYFLRN